LINAESHERDREGRTKCFLNNLIGIVEEGRIRRAWGSQRDITERKRAERELSKSEERYRDMVENAHDIIYSHDLEGNYTSINKAGERITGYTREEALKLNLVLTVAPEYRVKAQEMLARKLAGEEVTAYDLEIVAKGGDRITVEVNTRLVYQDGVPVGIQGIARDITERKRAEEMLRQVDRRAVEEYERLLDRLSRLALTFGTARDLQTIYRGLRDFTLSLTPSFALAICRYDEARGVREGVYFYVNGVELENPVIGEMPVRSGPAGRVIRGGDAIIFNDYLKEIREGGSAVNVGFEVDDDEPRSALIAPMAIMGRVVGTIEVQSHYLGAYTREHATAIQMAANLAANAIENVRLLNLEREKGEQLRQAQKMEAVGRLAGGIAHDFNNLLTAITGYSDLTLRRIQSESPLRRNVEEIKKAGERAASLTRQLLAFSRKQVLQPKVLDLNAVVSDMEKMLRRLIGEDIELRTALTPELGSVKADPGQIEQVLMNLAVNARDAMPHGGNLIIETENVYLNEGYATRHIAVKPGAYVMLAVSDTGEGMSEETQSRIFEPFFTTKEVGKGTGLGLSTVYGIVKQSGGNVWVYSEVGEGTVFKIYLPRVDEAAQEYKPGSEVQESLDGTEVILLAVFTAKSGEETLALLAKHDAALLITDQRMPGMSGIELLKRTAELRPHMVRMILTGYTDVGTLVEAINSGLVYQYLTKPWSNDDLRLTVTRALEHYESIRGRHELEMRNRRLLSRLEEIRELANADQ
jgi:PAS domain S-box-containing protein